MVLARTGSRQRDLIHDRTATIARTLAAEVDGDSPEPVTAGEMKLTPQGATLGGRRSP